MIKIPKLPEDAPPGAVASPFVGALWEYERGDRRKYFLKEEPDGFTFRRHKRTGSLLRGYFGTEQATITYAQNIYQANAVCFEFSSQAELAEWLDQDPNRAFCALCGQTPCNCQNEP